MKKKIFTHFFLSCLFVLAGFSVLQAQYTESFSTPSKGYKLSCADDLTGVNWTLSSWSSPSCAAADNRDASDYFNTTAAGVLESIDTDEEVYWESPLLDISAAGTVILSADLSWAEFDTDVTTNTCGTDYIKVQYSINGGAWVTVANQFGGNACATVGYPFQNPGGQFSSSGTVTQGGISGMTLRIRIAVKTSANAEKVIIDNVSVPQMGVTLGCTQPTITAVPANIVCNGANSGAIKVTASGATAPYNVSWSGTSSGNPGGNEIASSGGMYTISTLTAGTYTVSVTDAASCVATTTVSIVSSPLTQSAITSPASCGMFNGAIDLSASGGNPGYTYNWSNGAMAPDLSGLAPGSYSVTITDSSSPGCTSTAMYNVGTYAPGPYNETFSVPGRGYLLNQVNNLFGVNWTLSPWTTNQPETGIGRGNDDYLRTTTGGKLSGTDTNAEICWTSPLLNISSSGTAQFSLDLSWSGFDDEDYISVRHSLNGGAFVTKPNQVGGGAQTIQFAAPSVDQPLGSATVTQTGLSGSTLQIRVCFLTNSQVDTFSLDNVSIPQTVSLCQFICPTLAATSTTNYSIFSGDNTSDINVSTTVNDLNVKLVYFTTPQATNAARYTGGTMIGSSTAPTGASSPFPLAFNNLSFPINNTASPITYYVYAILDVTDPEYTDNTCQPSVAFEVTVDNNMTTVTGNTFCNTGSITLNDGGPGGQLGKAATPYPSNIFVSGLSGTILSVTVDLKGVVHLKSRDIDLLLVAPTGQQFLMMTGVGDRISDGFTGPTFIPIPSNLTLSDAAVSALPRSTPISSGTYRPASYESWANTFPAPASPYIQPAPAGPYSQAAPVGTATFASVFNGLDPNGTWQLFATDDTSGNVSGSIANGWCLNFTMTCPSLSTSPGPAIITNSTCATFGGTPSGGIIAAPSGTCPTGSTLQYSVDNGMNWSTSLPTYTQGTAQTILTRCNCDANTATSSPTSSVTTVPGTCPDCPVLTAQAPAVQVTNSTCATFGGTPSGGIIAAPSGTCPTGSTLQYSVDNGMNWSTSLPTYTQGTAQTILTRCNCDANTATSSPTSSVTTVPGSCPNCPVLTAQAPAVQVTNSTCATFGGTPSGGIIAAPSGTCPTGSTLQYSVDNGMNWSTSLPIYTQGTAQTILTRCNCDANTATSSPTSSVTTVPGSCPNCPVLTAQAPAVQVTNSTCATFGGTPSGGIIAAPSGTCPTGSTLQYSVDNGMNWSTSLPIYTQGTAQTILTRCNCDANTASSSPTSSVTTVPGSCPNCPVFTAQAPAVQVTNSTCSTGCILAGGTIAAPGGTCPAGSTLQYKVDNGVWSSTLPTYNQTTAQTIKTRCSCDADPSIRNDSSAVTTVPGTIPNPVVPQNGSLTVACLALATPPTFPVVTGCDGVVLTPSGPSIVDNPSSLTCEGTRTYTYTYSCGTGNSTWSYVYTIEREPFTVPADGASTVACLAAITVPVPPAVNSNCGEPIAPAFVSIVDSPSTLTCEGTRTYNYSYTDCEGNTLPWRFVYTIERLPFTVPSDGASTVACLAAITVPVPPAVNSNCGEPIAPAFVSIVDSPSTLTCEGTRTYNYSYTDCEGNTLPWRFVYTIEREPFTVPSDGASTVACLAAITVPVPPAVNSNCGEPIAPAFVSIVDSPSTLTCEGTRTYNYSYTDCEGNTLPWSYVYTIERLPFTVPADGAANVTCPSDATQPTPPIVLSNCGETLTPSGPVITTNPFQLVADGTKTYTWTYTDCEGNTQDWKFVYTIKDNTPPSITCPQDIEVCEGTIVTFTAPVGADNCAGAITVQTAGLGSGVTYPVGTTVNEFKVTAANGVSTTCTFKVKVNPLPTASISGTTTICKNGTAPDITFSASGGTAPYTFTYAINNGNSQTVSTTGSNTTVTVSVPANTNGVFTYNLISVKDASATTCSSSITTMNVATVTIEDCSVIISDPCTCENNAPIIANGTFTNAGTFGETITVNAPTGQTWKVSSVTGLYQDAAASTPVAVNDLFSETSPGVFTLKGYHIDSIGYAISVTNGRGTTLSASNKCFYPDPSFSGLPNLVSPNALPFNVTGTVANSAAGTGTFKLNGVTQAGGGSAPTQLSINPAVLPLGTNILEYSFDAGTAGSKDLTDPGCVKTIRQTFRVANCACQDVTVSLDANCQFVLTGNLVSDANCAGGTVRVMDNNPNNGNIIDCAGVWTYGLFDAFGNIICWGKVTAEDKTAPALVCAPADVTLDCYDVNYVLNNRLTIGNVGATSSPRPAATSPQTINNAEGVAGTGDNCQLGLAPPSLVSDNIKNLGYAYFKDNCYNCGCRITLKWSDKVEFYSCEQMKTNGGIYATISREWTATDCNGMRSSYVQKIKFTRPAVDDFVFNGPGEGKYDRVVEYNSCTPDKSLIKKEDVTPYVCSYFNTSANPRCLFIDQVECNYSVSIKDTEFPICGGKGVKIDREMYVLDWCAGGIVDTFHILIKIGDFTAPTVEYAHGAPYDISTGPMDCTAAIPVSVAGIKTAFGVTIKDNCNLGNISVSVYTKDRYVKGILVYEGPENPICIEANRKQAGELRGDNEDYRLGDCTKEDDICWEKVEYAVMNGMMIGLPVGKHLMVIEAFDGCYNASTTCFVFEVKDKIAPIMKCDDDLHVTLSNANGYTNGYAQVSAADIDEGSWDNCKLAWIAVRRNVPDGCAASFIQKGYDTNGNGKLDALPADGDVSKADGFDRNGDGDIADFGETFILKGGKLMTPLLDFVEFFCCDLTERVTVELWGGDIYGNTNYCWMDLLIEDKVAPTCLAPWDVTIYCDDKSLAQIDDKITSAKIFGDVTIPTGNDCAALDTVYSTEKKLKCGAGYIDRIWTLTKQTAKGPISVTCKQRIHILPVHEYNICFPKDVSTDCKTPIIDTVITDELGCDILAVNVHDKRYDASDDECYKIFRTYSVINWCTYDDRCGDPLLQTNISIIDRAVFGNYGKAPIYVLVRDREDNRRDGVEEFYISKDLIHNNADDIRFKPKYCEVAGEFYHSFIYTQIIKVYDDTRPLVTGIRDTFCTSPTACTANITKVVTLKDNCTDKVELETQFLMIAPFQTLDAGAMIMYSTPRWSTKDLGNGQFEIKVSNLPEGTHDLIVVGRDECGNLSLPTRIPFVVKDCKAPAPICINGLSVNLMPDGNNGGMMTVWASDFVASKIYDCNGQGPETKDGLKLITKYSVNRVKEPVNPNQTSISVNCADLELGFILVELHAWDAVGNHDFCVTYIEVQDNNKVCPTPADKVKIAGTITTEGAGNLQGVSVTLSGSGTQSDMTKADGNYEFVNITKGGDFTVTPQLDKNHLNGVSTFDLVLIQKHILGVQALNSPYKMIAADANNSKSISTLDLIQIRKLILNIDQNFQNNTSWRFVDATYRFPNPTNPWSAAFPEVVSVNDLATNVRANFVAIKVGDVNASASVNGAASAEIRTSADFKLKTLEQNLKSGNEYKVSFSAEDLKNIQGYQFALNLDQSKVELLDIEYGVAKAENFGVFKNEGLITTSWNSKYEPGALFTLVLRAKTDAKLSSTLSLNRLVYPEAYDQNNENLGIALNFEGVQASEAYELRQNTPNPFSDETLIGFSLPKAMKGTLTVRDVKGALVYKVEGNYAKGNNQVTLKKSQLGASGVLYYTLETSDFTATKKMIILQ